MIGFEILPRAAAISESNRRKLQGQEFGPPTNLNLTTMSGDFNGCFFLGLYARLLRSPVKS